MRIEGRGGTPLMPEMGHEAYLFQIWQEAGMCRSGFNGPDPLTAQELDCWSSRCLVPLSAWEFATVLKLSDLYCRQLVRSRAKDCLPPYGNPENDFDRAKVAKDIRQKMNAFLGAKKK